MILTMPAMSSDDIRKFWYKVSRPQPDKCWLWVKSVNKDGYGACKINYVTYLAHRIAYYIGVGDPGVEQVLHDCDVPACCNPIHLFLGDHYLNMQDCVSKNRNATQNRRIYDLVFIKLVKAEREQGFSYSQLAQRHDVPRGTLHGLVHMELS